MRPSLLSFFPFIGKVAFYLASAIVLFRSLPRLLSEGFYSCSALARFTPLLSFVLFARFGFARYAVA